ncbi:MAG: arsenosugar biosynthesis radical SAM (seleno)protein ArsS [Gammaproteobacteria bacterium]
MHNTLALLQTTDFPQISRLELETLQVNLGYLCNLSCLHCHVNAGPKRKEIMDRETIDQIVKFIQSEKIKTLDLTGGAPEMNPHFRDLVIAARSEGCKVIDRCNLTILQQEGFETTAEFLAENQVEIVASLPCYLEDNVDKQRGDGVFIESIKSLQKLNSLGYGKLENPELVLNLVYNPQGISLPPAQKELEIAYKQHLKQDYGINFNSLFTITNMPIKRFGSTLVSKGQFEPYMQTLRENYQQENLDSLMCKTIISVDWQGYTYDCDFNQMLGLPTPSGRKHISELNKQSLTDNPISVLDHCYGCTAGQGSSCGGALD